MKGTTSQNLTPNLRTGDVLFKSRTLFFQIGIAANLEFLEANINRYLREVDAGPMACCFGFSVKASLSLHSDGKIQISALVLGRGPCLGSEMFGLRCD